MYKTNMNPIRIYVEHYQSINNQLDIIKNVDIKWLVDTKQEYLIVNRFHYLIVLLILNYITLDTALVIYQHCVVETECINLINSTRLIPHRLFPQSFWYQGDLIIILAMFMATSNFFILLFANCLNFRYCIYAIFDKGSMRLFDYERRIVPIPIARKMVRYRSITRKTINCMVIAIFIVVYIFFIQQVWINSYYQINELIFYFLILPIVLFNLALGNILVISLCIITINIFFKQPKALEKYFFGLCSAFDVIVLAYFIRQCVKITRNNTMIEYKHRCHLLKLLWFRKMSFHTKLKSEIYMMNPRLEKCGFTFWNHRLIESNCYLYAFYIITVFFMLTYDKQEY
ncbi:hypothetical protein RDWZM_000427 [Blomia tropicalis]|uniref:Uncharacterized protein n=1 Tax=Blomia tropicalis TaxID=40697 RepID=A0A9Q0MCS4_BLOTA|nr:hypothetical protein RDWZM_000427 [Blomia tropicalis]